MSDTKQQCPTEMYVCEIANLILHRDQTYIFRVHPDCKACSDYFGHDSDPTKIAESYADHCTAPLKLQRYPSRQHSDEAWRNRTNALEAELTAERTRREAAERERDELLEAARKVVKFWNTNDGYFGDLAAALRGKGELNG